MKKKADIALRHILIACLFLVFAAYDIQAAAVKDEIRDYKSNLDKTKNDLNSIKAAIRLQRENIQKDKFKEKATTRYIQKIEKELDITRKELLVYKNNIGVLESGITDLNSRIKETEGLRKSKEKSVKELLRRQYEKQDKTYIKFLFKSGGISDFIKKYKFVKIISAKNALEVEQYMMLMEKLQSDEAAILGYKVELDSVKKDKEDQSKRFQNESWQKRILLKGIQSNIKERGNMIKDLELSAKKLTKLLDTIEVSAQMSDKDAAAAFSQNKGKFPWPVDEGFILAKFGKYKHPQFKSIVENRGLHISVKYGEPVYSVFSGVVKYADWFEGYGKMVVVYHGSGYYTIYAHLSETAVFLGAKVGMKQIIGKAGDTESFYGNELYFEMRNKGVPVDPLKYLKRR